MPANEVALAGPPAPDGDLSIWLSTGRTKSPAQTIDDGVDAERLGFRRVFLSERYDLKEAGVLLGGVGARTSRVGLGTGILAITARHPLLTAALAATMQAAYGHRFVLGLGRSDGVYLRGQGISEGSYQAYEDYFGILRRLLAGETVTYDGPVGRFDAMRMADVDPGEPPELWASSLGGPRASRLAARIADGVLLTPFLTPSQVASVVRTIREERERAGLDPASITILQPIVTAPELDDDQVRELAHARLLTYIVGMPAFVTAYLRNPGWEEATMHRILAHPQFSKLGRGTADQEFHRNELLEPARLVPDRWVEDTCAIGSLDNCMRTLQSFKDTGVDELACYATTPAQNAGLIERWRRHSKPM